MRATKTSCAKYLDLYETSWSRLVAETPHLRDYKNGSIQTTWMISYERIRQRSPTAAQFLQLWAYLDHQDMWYELISRGSRGCQGHNWLQELTQSEIDFKSVMKALLDYSLVESRQNSESYSLHPVVHDWCAETISSSRDDLMIAALTIVGYAAPDRSEGEYWISQQRLLPHADRCAWELHGIDVLNDSASADICDAFYNLSYLYVDQGKYNKAEKMFQRALDGHEIVWGLDHTSTLDIVNTLGKLYKNQGKYSEAEKMYQRALNGHEKVSDPDCTSILHTVINLGHLYVNQGKYSEARKMFQKALNGQEKARGLNPTSTFDTVHSLGTLYVHQGKFNEAEKMYQQMMNGFRKKWGPDHIFTLNIVNNLGVLYNIQDKYDEAEKMYRRALAGYEKAWGLDHPSTLRTRNNLHLLNASRGGHIKVEEKHPRALDSSNGAHDTNLHPQSPPSTAKAILNKLKAGMRRRERDSAGQ